VDREAAEAAAAVEKARLDDLAEKKL